MGALTHERSFGLTEKPFSLSSDPRFLYRSPSHAAAFDKLLAGIERREGVLVLTGDIGTVKTTLCRRDKLKLPQMRQVDQRVSVHWSLEPLSREALPGSIAHRLVVAGARPECIYSPPDALDAVYDVRKILYGRPSIGQGRQSLISTQDSEQSVNNLLPNTG
jgi:type II secretory pathway predicted ATPase ExeA